MDEPSPADPDHQGAAAIEGGDAVRSRPRHRVAIAATAVVVIAIVAVGLIVLVERHDRTSTVATGDSEVVYLAPDRAVSRAQLEGVVATMNRRFTALGYPPGAKLVGSRIGVTVPRSRAAAVRRALTDQGVLQFRPVLAEVPDLAGAHLTVTQPEQDDPTATVVLPPTTDLGNATSKLAAYRLGPVALDGTAIEDAAEGESGTSTHPTYVVAPVFRAGAKGIDKFNKLAAACYAGTTMGLDDESSTTVPNGVPCPTGELAIVYDHQVLSAPFIEQPSFKRDQIEIAGSFTKDDATNLAAILRSGALPFRLKVTH
jgi:preprotein translocase subunit SecD